MRKIIHGKLCFIMFENKFLTPAFMPNSPTADFKMFINDGDILATNSDNKDLAYFEIKQDFFPYIDAYKDQQLSAIPQCGGAYYSWRNNGIKCREFFEIFHQQIEAVLHVNEIPNFVFKDNKLTPADYINFDLFF